MSDNRYIKATAPASAAPVGATLMKTGQTTSYATGDDGDIEAGRATSFLVLPSNNPFGNTNRFTDELGGQTYTKNIVIDWSTYNGNNVLGYKRTLQTSANWATAIASCLAVSISPFTSGWRMSNITEINNIWDKSRLLNDKFPTVFNLPGVDIWSANSTDASTAIYFPNSFVIPVYTSPKVGNNRGSIAVRNFTVTGTTLS
jgi:hypothetical protein